LSVIFVGTFIATPFVGLVAFVGQFLCLFAPNKDEKLFAGLAIGSLLVLIVLPIVIALVVGAVGLGFSAAGGEESGEAVVGVLTFALLLSPVALLLANVLFMFLFFQRLGRNIKSKAVEQAAKIAMGSWIASVANLVVFFIFIMVVGMLYRSDPTKAPAFLPVVLQIWVVVTAILNLVVIITMVAMGTAAVKHTKVV
jgi:hypothetical protein